MDSRRAGTVPMRRGRDTQSDSAREMDRKLVEEGLVQFLCLFFLMHLVSKELDAADDFQSSSST